MSPLRLISFGYLHLPTDPEGNPVPPAADRIEDVRDRLHDPAAARANNILDLDGTHPMVQAVVLRPCAARGGSRPAAVLSTASSHRSSAWCWPRPSPCTSHRPSQPTPNPTHRTEPQMNDASLKDGMFSVTITGRFYLDNRPIACPKCGAWQGLTFSAFIDDQMAGARCPRNHVWDEPKLNGHIVRDVHRRNTGQAT